MKKKDKENVIRFYEEICWMDGLKDSDELSDKDLKDLKNTLWFARWMLRTEYEKIGEALADVLKKLIKIQ